MPRDNKQRLRRAIEALDDAVNELKAELLFKDSDETLNEISKLSKHAKALSRVGSSKGGIARAKSLSPERRREIAQIASKARWNLQRISFHAPRLDEDKKM
jgi:hypothetical protein